MSGRRAVLGGAAIGVAALCAIFPALVLLTNPRDAALGPFSVDLGGHLWTAWSVSRGEFPRSHLIGWPEGVDLLPVLGGWLDVLLAGGLSRLVGLPLAYNLVLALYLWVAGIGGAALARALGAGWGAALIGGFLLQADPFLMIHLHGGRPEQVGLGFVALLLASSLRTARGEGSPVWAGLSAALLVYGSWELSLLAGLVMLGLAPALGSAGLRRLLPALGLALALAGPWALTFFVHTGATRAVDEGAFALQTAARASITALQWPHAPVGLGLLTLLALPWTLSRRDRGLGIAAALGLAMAWVLALGPTPGLQAPGDLGVTGPFALLRGLPLLGWFHWPDRLLALFSLAVAGSAALAVERLGRRGVLLALALLANAWLRLEWPRATFRLESPPELVALSELPGAVLDLPFQPDRVAHLGYQLDQITHGHPILFHMVLTHLGPDQQALWRQDPALGWFIALMDERPPAPRTFAPADFGPLKEQGFETIVLHQQGWPGDRWAMARRGLGESLGEPSLRVGERWIAWRLPPSP